MSNRHKWKEVPGSEYRTNRGNWDKDYACTKCGAVTCGSQLKRGMGVCQYIGITPRNMPGPHPDPFLNGPTIQEDCEL
jgi:hypothetical protein